MVAASQVVGEVCISLRLVQAKFRGRVEALGHEPPPDEAFELLHEAATDVFEEVFSKYSQAVLDEARLEDYSFPDD